MAYKYNPLLKLDLQKVKEAPEPPQPVYDNELSTTSENAVQNKVITTKINEIETDTRKKVSKFFTSIEELEIGEIGEYQGETNETFTNGYFYKRGNDGVGINYGESHTQYFSKDIEFYRDGNLVATQAYVGLLEDFANSKNRETSDWKTVCFFFKKGYFFSDILIDYPYNSLNEGYLYPYAYDKESHSFDFDNPLSVENGQIIYKGSALTFSYTGYGETNAPIGIDKNTLIKYVWFIATSGWRYALPVSINNNVAYISSFSNIESIDDWNVVDVTPYSLTYQDYTFVQGVAVERVDTQPALDPADFATAAQGEKADTALQSIAKGTDGNYITTTIGAKADNSQTVSASLTLQPISTAGASAKGLAEASDVKAYIGNNTATPAQGEKADSALQQVVHGTDGQFVTTTVTQKADNSQTIYSALTIQGIATADAQHQGIAEASDVKFYLDIMNATSEAYGVMWDTANPSPTLTRIGNMTNHALLPVQSQMIGGVMADDGSFTPFDNQSDWTQATQSRDGSDGQVMVRLPKHWRKCSPFGTYNIVMLSPVEIPGYVEVREQYVSAYEASLQRSTLKLSSVNNATADYRGGQNEASWDGTYRTLLNRPVTSLNLAEFRTYARNRGNGTKWNCMTYEAVRTIYWLFVTEYATLNSQADYTSELDDNGYHQGGLGIGVSDWNGTAWNDYNGYAPLIPCGILDEYGSGTAVMNFSIYNADTTLAHTFQCNKYRGIEMPFGDLWEYVDGVLINVESGDGVSTAYTTLDPANFSSTSVANYNAICNTYRVNSYIKGIVFNANGDIFATQNGADSSSYYCDQYWGTNLPSTTELRAWRFGGNAHYGAYCGLACAFSTSVPGIRNRNLGSRLCFVP